MSDMSQLAEVLTLPQVTEPTLPQVTEPTSTNSPIGQTSLQVTEPTKTSYPTGQNEFPEFDLNAYLTQLGITYRPERPSAEDEARIREQYPGIDDCTLHKVWLGERDDAVCAGCTGECRKSASREQYNVHCAYKTMGSWFDKLVYCKYGEQRHHLSLCRTADIPGKCLGKTFADYKVTGDNQHAVKLAQAFCDKRPAQGLYLHGDCGTGKTLLASIIAAEFVSDWVTVKFADVPELLNTLKRSFDKTGESAQAWMDMYCHVDLLILDDFGVGKISEWNLDIMYQLVNTRYNSRKPTLVTSNYDLNGLARRLTTAGDDMTGKRIASRLSEMCVSAKLSGADMRLRR